MDHKHDVPEARGRTSTEDVADSRGRTSTGDAKEPSLAQQLSDLARTLESEPDVDDTLQRIVRAAVDNIPGAKHAAIMLIVDRKLSIPAVTAEVAAQVDRVQFEVGEGPCLTAIRGKTTVRVEDMTDEPRFPRFAVRAVELGVQSMLSLQLFVRDRDLGSLSVMGDRPHALGDEAEQIGLLLAAHASVALRGAQHQLHMDSALANRDLIGQAKGVLMERYKIDADRAFALLVRASQESNRKLHDVARQVTETGQDPTAVAN